VSFPKQQFENAYVWHIRQVHRSRSYAALHIRFLPPYEKRSCFVDFPTCTSGQHECVGKCLWSSVGAWWIQEELLKLTRSNQRAL